MYISSRVDPIALLGARYTRRRWWARCDEYDQAWGGHPQTHTPIRTPLFTPLPSLNVILYPHLLF